MTAAPPDTPGPEILSSSAVGRRAAFRLLLLALVLCAFAWRIVRLDFQSLWRDEIDAIYFAMRNLDETLAMFTAAAQNGPLYFVALRPWLSLVGSSEFVLRFPSAVAGTLSVPLLWQVGRELVPVRQPAAGSTTALVAALLLACNPYQVWYAQEGKMYATITCLALLATWCWLLGVARGGWRPWLGYWLTVTVAMYTHLLMVLLIPLHAAWFALAWPRSRRRWRGFGLALLGLTLPYVPMVWWHWSLLTSPAKLTGFNFTPLDRMVQALALGHSKGFGIGVDLLWLAPLFFLFGAGILLGKGEIGSTCPGEATLSAGRRYAMLLAWLVLPILLLFLVSLRQPVFTERYLIWIGPAALLIVALGLQVVRRHGGRLGVPLATALVVYLLGFWLYIGWQQKTVAIKYDLRSAVQYVQAHRASDSLLVLQIPHQEWAYRYYSSDQGPDPFANSDERLARWGGGPYTNWGRPDDVARVETDVHMQGLVRDAQDVWVMLSEVPMWDSRRLMDAWLNEHAQLLEQEEFTGVQVRHYEIVR